MQASETKKMNQAAAAPEGLKPEMCGTDPQIEIGQTAGEALESVGDPTAPEETVQTTSNPSGSESAVYIVKKAGKFVVIRVAAGETPSGAVEGVTDEFLSHLASKEIDGYVMDMLKVGKIGKSKDKASAIKRFWKTTLTLPVTGTVKPGKAEKTEKAPKVRKESKPKVEKNFTVSIDPADEKQKAAFNNLAPQGKACVLAALGLRQLPKAQKSVTMSASELEPKLESLREIFSTEQPLKRIWGYHRPVLIAGGFLAVDGTAKPPVRATDKYTYAFKFKAGDKAKEAFKALPPQAQDCLRIALGSKLHEVVDAAAEIDGVAWRAKLVKGKDAGKLKTKQNPFRIFQYQEHLLVDAGFLNVRS
jgi:hypothetical protein